MDEQEKNLQGATDGAGGSVDRSVESVDYKTLYTGLSEQMKEITAERDSLKAENEKLLEQTQALTVESQKVRETNYTLSRQLDLTQSGAKQTPEEILFDAFIKKGD